MEPLPFFAAPACRSFARGATLFLFFCLFPALAGAANAGEENPDTLANAASGLTWKRCAEGLRWDGKTCKGSALRLSPAEAKARAKGGWRVPTVGELATLIDHRHSRPAIDFATFPHTPTSPFWSATPAKNEAQNFWAVNFADGAIYPASSDKFFYLRLVRGTATPKTFTDLGDGTVLEEPANLLWKRCAEGQSGSVASCLGLATSLNWKDALKVGGAGWRLPTQRELAGLVDWTKYRPALDWTAFPHTPMSSFWSATADAASKDRAWYVRFDDGYADSGEQKEIRHVRLVRDEAPVNESGAALRHLAERVFNWAEKTHGNYFYPANRAIEETQGYLFRYYPYSGLYLAIKDDRLWLVGGFAGEQIRDAGSLTRRFAQARAAGF